MSFFKSALILLPALALLGGVGCAVEPEGGHEEDVTSHVDTLLTTPNAIPGQYIVVLKESSVGAALTSVQEASSHLAGRYGGEIFRTYEHALRGFALRASESQAKRLAADPAVKYVVEDGVVQADATQFNAPWGLDRIDQRNRPLNAMYVYDLTGAGVHAYIIDTGIRVSHADFGGRASADFTSINDGGGALDCNGHGTHVAGTVGGATWGVAKRVRLHAVRVLGCDGFGSVSGVIAGVDWVTANHVKPAVANMSLGGRANTALDDAVRASIRAGVTYVVAAGNSDADACNQSPARTTEALTVGASDRTDTRAGFSNWGSCLDLFAPGVDIPSAWHTSDSATASLSGTSMASPHVAGVVARLLEAHPTSSPATVVSVLTHDASLFKVATPKPRSPDRLLYADVLTLQWSSAGALSGRNCVQILETADPYTWNDNYLCSKESRGIQWSSAGPRAGMRCTQIIEPSDPHTWNDNYLCVPFESPIQFSWSYAGPIAGKACVRWDEAADPHTWTDNYLCFDMEPALTWSSAGPLAGKHCVQLLEPADPHTWNDNYLCSTGNQGIRWNSAGPLAGGRCTQIVETADPHTWNDNYLCVPNLSSLLFQWSSAGPIPGRTCVRWYESADPYTWDDNYLCY